MMRVVSCFHDASREKTQAPTQKERAPPRPRYRQGDRETGKQRDRELFMLSVMAERSAVYAERWLTSVGTLIYSVLLMHAMHATYAYTATCRYTCVDMWHVHAQVSAYIHAYTHVCTGLYTCLQHVSVPMSMHRSIRRSMHIAGTEWRSTAPFSTSSPTTSSPAPRGTKPQAPRTCRRCGSILCLRDGRQ